MKLINYWGLGYPKVWISFWDAWGHPSWESPWTGRTGQPYPHMGLAHMSAYGYPGGGWSFTAPLNLVLVDPFDAPHIQMRGCHVGWDCNLQGSQGESLLCWYAPLSYGSRGFRFSLFGPLRGWLWHSVGRGLASPLGRRLGYGHGGLR